MAEPPVDQSVHNGETELGAVAGKVAELVEQLRAENARAAARERVIDHLHAEVERLRIGEQGLLLRPVITDLQTLRRDLLRQAETMPEQLDAAQVRALLTSFALDVEQALERCGTVPVHPEVGDEYSPRQHSAVRILTAQVETQHEKIAEVLADGYVDTRTDRVTVPARVAVWRWTPPQPEPAQPEPAERATDRPADVLAGQEESVD